MTNNTPAQQEAAIQEGERIAAADEYFKARAWIMDTNDNRRIFEAGFDRAYALLSKLRAPVAGERAAFNKWAVSLGYELGTPTVGLMLAGWNGRAALASAPVSEPKRAPVDDGICWSSKEIQRRQREEDEARAAYYHSRRSAPVAGEATQDLAPPECPITRRPFFMALEHPELGMVPTYGGPYDSYTIPHLGGKPDQPWHERELRVYRYDHDLGGWLTNEVEVIPLRIVHEDVLNGLEDAAPQASATIKQSLNVAPQASEAVLQAARQVLSYTESAHRPPVRESFPTGATARVRIHALADLHDAVNAALSAQPGAQKGES